MESTWHPSLGPKGAHSACLPVSQDTLPHTQPPRCWEAQDTWRGHRKLFRLAAPPQRQLRSTSEVEMNQPPSNNFWWPLKLIAGISAWRNLPLIISHGLPLLLCHPSTLRHFYSMNHSLHCLLLSYPSPSLEVRIYIIALLSLPYILST